MGDDAKKIAEFRL